MLIRDVGEKGLIQKLSDIVSVIVPANTETQEFPVLVGIGDDSAVWKTPETITVTTSDALVEGIHFSLDHIDWVDLGWKSLAASISDIAAMGCVPLYSTVTLGLRGDLLVEDVERLYKGMAEISSTYGGQVVGGDVVMSPVIFVSVSMYGVVSSEGNLDKTSSTCPFLRRSKAAPGDVIMMTGTLGCASGGLRMFQEGLSSVMSAETVAHLTRAHNRPIPRVLTGIELVRNGVQAAMDISDGLVTDLEKLCETSGVSAIISAHNLPVDQYLKKAFPNDWLSLALLGGEDFEILFTVSPKLLAELKVKLTIGVTEIGYVEEGPPNISVLDENGYLLELADRGWEHFVKGKQNLG